jgi:O6-methylguanine-DNA--protein-cysteine methyltransferase
MSRKCKTYTSARKQPNGVCFECNQWGHFRVNCPYLTRRENPRVSSGQREIQYPITSVTELKTIPSETAESRSRFEGIEDYLQGTNLLSEITVDNPVDEQERQKQMWLKKVLAGRVTHYEYINAPQSWRSSHI